MIFLVMKEMGYTPDDIAGMTWKQILFIWRGLKRYYKEQEEYVRGVR